MAEGSPEQMVVSCVCGAKLRVRASAVGKKAKCPKCGSMIAIQAASAPPPPPAAAESGGALLDDLADFEKSASAAAAPAAVGAAACPNCGLAMPPNARLCMACGYDLKAGKAHKMAATAAAPSKAAVLARSAGGFMLGTGLSALGALIGAAAWCIVAIVTDYEIGWIAWLLGLLAGAGMYLGWRQADARGGIVAAGIAFCGIVAAKVMIFAWFVTPIDQAVVQAMEKNDPRVWRVAEHRSQRAAQHAGLSPWGEEASELHNSELDKCAKLTEEQLASAALELDAWEAEGKWSDQEYVHDALVYEHARRAAAKKFGVDDIDEEELEGVPPEEWKTYFTEATAKVDAMSAKARLADLKSLEAKRDRQGKEWRLAGHQATLEADKLGLWYKNDQRGRLREERNKEAEKLSKEQLDEAIAKLDEWEQGGKWRDADYVRNELILRKMKVDYEGNPASHGSRSIYKLSEQEWQSLHAKTAAKVDAMKPEFRVMLLRKLDELNEYRSKNKQDKARKEQNAAVRYASGDLIGAILRSFVHPMQILFIILAVASAYRVASNGFSFGGSD